MKQAGDDVTAGAGAARGVRSPCAASAGVSPQWSAAAPLAAGVKLAGDAANGGAFAAPPPLEAQGVVSPLEPQGVVSPFDPQGAARGEAT